MARLVLAACSVVVLARGLELTNENWEKETLGKSVFLKFFAPWCGHCKAMKPAWDKLMEEYKDSKDTLVADVDCTGEGKDLCEEKKVEGFPTIRWGDADDLQDYDGEREFEDLLKFTEEQLGPQCGPDNLDLCDDEQKAKIGEYMNMDVAKLEELIREGDGAIANATSQFDAAVLELQATYDKMEADRDANVKKVKAGGLGMQRSVRALKRQNKNKEDL